MLGPAGGARRILEVSDRELCKLVHALADPFRVVAHEAVTTIEDIARTTRQVFGGEHPRTVRTEVNLRNARAMLRAREASSGTG